MWYWLLRIPDALKNRFEVDSAHAAKLKWLEQQVVDANTSKGEKGFGNNTSFNTSLNTVFWNGDSSRLQILPPDSVPATVH